MACPNCGSVKIKDANFCVKCGYQFSKDSLEECKDNYRINVGQSTVLGLCSGILTGIFSAGLQETIHLEWWGWCIVMIATTLGITFLIYNSFNAVKNSLERQLRRKSD